MKDRELRQALRRAGYISWDESSDMGLQLVHNQAEQVDELARRINELESVLERALIIRPSELLGGYWLPHPNFYEIEAKSSAASKKIAALAEATGYEFVDEPEQPPRTVCKRKTATRRASK